MRLQLRRSLPLLALIAVASLFAACGPSGPSTGPSSTTAETRPSSTAAAPSHAPSAAGSVAASSSAVATTTQTDTAWGRIWDALPSGFPTFPGSTPADDAGIKDVSAAWAVTNGEVKAIADWFQRELEGATFSTSALSGPQEDGSYVLDSVGDAGCKIETVVAPTGGLTLITVKYGAACPNA
jgi:hypothetical protein